MLFSSLTFVFLFLPVTILVYYCLSFHTGLKNTWLLLASLLFYSWGEPKFVFVLIGSIVANYIFGLLVHHWKDRKDLARIVVVVMCITNVGLLFVYKYLAFAVSSIYALFDKTSTFSGWILPIGISFFTFQAMSYVFDVYHEQADVQKNPIYLALYISFFPQLVAGPIVRYTAISHQMIHRKETLNKFSVGCCRFVLGLGKKVLLANSLALVTDTIFTLNATSLVSVSLAWLGAIAYTLQIFFDFSAYSDMAIGLGLMFGFKFDENFNYPYISLSATEFWRRWHISLGNWFKHYVYIPLGGSRVQNKDIMVRNLLIVWLCTGIWHGASWTFVFWGMWNFLFVLAEKILDIENLSLPTWIRRTYTLLFITFGMVLFRAETFSVASDYFAALFGGGGQLWSDYTGMLLSEYGVYFLMAILLCAPIGRRMNYYISQNRRGSWLYHWSYPVALLAVFALSVSYLVVGSYNPFIYFNF